MQSVAPRLTEQDQLFYRSTLFQLAQDGKIGASPGSDMLRVLRKETLRTLDGSESPEYASVVNELYKVVTDSLVSAVHRSAPHELINRASSGAAGLTVITDEQECQFHAQDSDLYGEEDDEEPDTESDGELKSITKDNDPKMRKHKELQRKKRLKDEEMLVRERKVLDDKNNAYRTVGPHPAPRLTVRSTFNTFPSRKALQHRTVAETPSPSPSDEDEDAPELPVSSSSAGEDAVEHLTEYLQPLSVDSLKKIGESAKAKLRPASPHDEFVSTIVKTAVRLGCEKACVLMEKQKMIDDMTAHVQTGPLPKKASVDYLNNLPEQTKRSLGDVLGLPEENPPAEDMWERMVAMGFLAVLTNLRLKPLKKIATELGINIPDSNSTEKFCEAVVFAAFPRERVRAKVSRAKLKRVKFTVPPEGLTVKGDMGFISFRVDNISMLNKETERHYSPEFNFAQLKWSLLCMANKESLALYLCQVGSVHCKFLITVVNRLDPANSIWNEGTQCFSAASQENDWGFNSVMKFTDLMDPARGFWDPDTDSITIQVGIVLVEPVKPTREKPAAAKDKKAAGGPRVDEEALRQLLADEKAEQTRKRVRQEMNKTVREEERTRKDLGQRSTKAYHELCERLKTDTKRVAKDLADRERREEQERQRELEKIRQAQEQSAEMRRRLEALKAESAELAQERQQLSQEAKDLKRSCEKLNHDLKSSTDRLQQAQQKARTQEKKVDAARRRLDSLRAEEPATPSPSDEDVEEPTFADEDAAPEEDGEDNDEEDDTDFINADLTRLIDEMTVDI